MSSTLDLEDWNLTISAGKIVKISWILRYYVVLKSCSNEIGNFSDPESRQVPRYIGT